MISILLACYKSEKLLDYVFCKSLKNISTPVQLVLYDNGGNGDLNRFRGDEKFIVKVIGNGQNIGLNAALNECFKQATMPYFYLPHTDMYILPNCLESLVKEAKKHAPHSFLFCSRSIEPTKGHTNHHIIKNFGQEAHEFGETQLLNFFNHYSDKGIEIGARMPFFGHRKLLEKMIEFNAKNNICDGPFDTAYYSYTTDDDFIQTAHHLGVRKLYLLQESVVYHLQGKSNNQQKVDKDSNTPYLWFVDKWRKIGYYNAEHPGMWHPKIIPFGMRVR